MRLQVTQQLLEAASTKVAHIIPGTTRVNTAREYNKQTYIIEVALRRGRFHKQSIEKPGALYKEFVGKLKRTTFGVVSDPCGCHIGCIAPTKKLQDM